MRPLGWVIVPFVVVGLAACTGTPVSTPVEALGTPTYSAEPAPELDITDFVDFAKRGVDVDPRNVGLHGGDPIEIRRPDSAGGVDVGIFISNVSSKTIDYAVFELIPFNAVGDPVTSEIGGESAVLVRFTGPLTPLDGRSARWKDVWYNGTITYVEIVGVDLEFSDDSTLHFDLSDEPIRGDFACVAIEGMTQGKCRLADPL